MSARLSRASRSTLSLLFTAGCSASPSSTGTAAEGESGIIGPITTLNGGNSGPSRGTDSNTSTSGDSTSLGVIATEGAVTSGTATEPSTMGGDVDESDEGPTPIRFDVLAIPDVGIGNETEDCGSELFGSQAIPPNILIVLDRSHSMEFDINNVLGGEPTKWDIATQAIEDVTTAYGEQIRFGLMLFPGTGVACGTAGACDPGGVFIDPAPDTTVAIQDQIEASGACAPGTPIGQSLAPLVGYEGLQDPERGNFILLLTDGRPQQCPEVDLAATVTDLREQPQEVRTFVVGFGDGVDPVQLASMAVAGGTAIDADPVYYQADNATALSDAFAAIAGSILSCNFALDEAPPDVDDLYVFFDTTLVERDTTREDGWDYDADLNQVTFYGPACEAIQSNSIGEVNIVFGCPVLPEG